MNFPASVSLEITNACSGKCVMCSHRYSKRPIVHISMELIEKVILEAKEFGLGVRERPILLCGVGEPTLHPNFCEILKVVGSTWINFGSNCENLTDRHIEALLDVNLAHATFSVDEREGLDHKVIRRNVCKLLNHLRKRKLPNATFRLSIVAIKQLNYLNEHIKYWLPRIEGIPNISLYLKAPHKWPGTPHNIYWPPPKLDLPVELLNHPQLELGDFTTRWPVDGNCRMLWTFAAVQSDGAYCPCCMSSEDLFLIGNLNKMTLEECYNSRMMKHYRDLFLQREFSKIPLCRECGA